MGLDIMKCYAFSPYGVNTSRHLLILTPILTLTDTDTDTHWYWHWHSLILIISNSDTDTDTYWYWHSLMLTVTDTDTHRYWHHSLILTVTDTNTHRYWHHTHWYWQLLIPTLTDIDTYWYGRSPLNSFAKFERYVYLKGILNPVHENNLCCTFIMFYILIVLYGIICHNILPDKCTLLFSIIQYIYFIEDGPTCFEPYMRFIFRDICFKLHQPFFKGTC
jgi:hypothetical protein